MSRRCRQTQFLSTAGFGNEMKLKSRLPPFSLIRIWCQRVFCLRLRSRLHLSKLWYTRTVRLDTLGCFRLHVWDRVLCRRTGNYHWYCKSLAGYAISRWPDWYGDRLFFQIRVRKDSVHINHCPSSEKYANCIHRHRALSTITRIDQWLGGGGAVGGWGVIAIQTKITAACAFILSSRFRPLLSGLEPGRSAEPRLRSHGVCKSI